MFTARTVVVIIALGAGHMAASHASEISDAPFALAGVAATSSVARTNPTIKFEEAATAATPFLRRTTAQK